MMNRIIIKNTIKLLPSLSPKVAQINSRGYADGFSYLFPDIPTDDSSNNYLLNVPKQGELINFQKIDPLKSFRAVLKTLFEVEGCFEELNAIDLNEAFKMSFDEVYSEIDKNLVHLNYAYSMFSLMFNFKPYKYTLRKSGNQKLMKANADVRLVGFKSKTIFKIMLNLDKQRDKLSEQQKRVVKKYITEGKLNGLHLEVDLAVDQYNKIISKFTQDFMDNVVAHSQNFVQKIINPEYVKTVPHYLRSMIEGKSKVNLFFSPTVYDHFLANCNDQNERYAYWVAYNNRASLGSCDRKIANNIVIEEIVTNRRKLASRLGFINYIEYALQTRTLDSILVIKEFIEKMFEQTRNVYNQDLTAILKFAASNPEYRSKNLNIWDLSYFTTQLKNKQLANHNKDINHYFPVQKVIDGIFKFLITNFNIKIERIESKELKDNPLGDRIEYYRMYFNDQFVGNFYINLFSQIRTPHVRNITDRCDQFNVTPISGLFLNYGLPFEGQQLTMSFVEVISLFRSFGAVLDHLLPKNGYAEISGVNSINKDFKDLTANLLQLFAMHDYDIIKECSENIYTGESLPRELYQNLVDGYLKFKSINLTEEIYRSALDFALYSQNEQWTDIQRAIYDKYMSPFEFGKENYHLCSDIALICGSNVGAYYCQLYSQVLAADLFMSTRNQDSSSESKNNFDLLNSYANYFLLNEKGTNDLEAFRKIRGRDFSIKPFLSLNRFQNSQESLEKIKVCS